MCTGPLRHVDKPSNGIHLGPPNFGFLTETRADWQYAVTRELTLRSGASFGVDRYGLGLSNVDDPDAARDYAERFPARVKRRS